ncbi:BlaI/MecI/CopY family transcriptional regulator [Armatimonas rosea]|uniref:Putative transcriptional regulator n=1 Tax=Armatimonas rosea TaxID=685828 RepID=A0A7W9SNY3_ARMRO|nr:BlaI/MecI/CopY family transcriptional regulator [Armatimonas rosea]MBB6050105.1 putative transcriptional regulator [Armatimonas rosea]
MPKPTLGNLELEILQHITEHAPVTVGQVTESFAVPRGFTRSTINTSVERLFKKGYLTRTAEPEGTVFRYSPAVPSEEVLSGLVERFVENTLAGSLSPFVAYFARRKPLSAEEVAQLRSLVDTLEAAGAQDESDKPQ